MNRLLTDEEVSERSRKSNTPLSREGAEAMCRGGKCSLRTRTPFGELVKDMVRAVRDQRLLLGNVF